MSQITIENLTVRFDVDGDEQERAFARLLERYIGRFRRAEAEAERLRDLQQRARRIGDRTRGAGR